MILAENRKVRFDYEILETLEAGIVLEGWEVKSLRAKQASLRGGWVRVRDGEASLTGVSISPWKFGDITGQSSLQDRRLLLRARQIRKLEQQVLEKKITVLPYKLYLKKGKIKCELAIGKGRQRHEKKQHLKEKSLQREARQAMKQY